jgi:hypothetical protein
MCLLYGANVRAGDKEQCISESEAGQGLALDRKFVEARSHFVACARDVCPLTLVRDCTAELARVDASIATVVLSARDVDTDRPIESRVLIDGVRVSAPLDGRALPINPGSHVIRFELKTGAVREERVVIEEGARLKPLVGAFDLGTTKRKTGAGLPALAYVFGAVGVVGLGASAFFGVEALTQWNELRSKSPTQYTSSDVTSLKTKQLLADISFGVGIVGLGTAVWLAISRPNVEAGRTLGGLPEVHVGPHGGTATWQLDL